MNCPTCGAAMRLDRKSECQTCDFCQFTHFPEKNADGVRGFDIASTMECPVCRIPMSLGSVKGSPVDHCLKCRGSVIEMPAFGAIVTALRAERRFADSLPPADPRELERRLDCPKCGAHMDTHVFGGPGNIVIDNCPECLLNFLDHNELNRIATAPEPHAQSKPRTESTHVDLLGPSIANKYVSVTRNDYDANDPAKQFLHWLVSKL